MSDFLAWVARSGVVQGVIIGATLAFLTAIAIMNLVARTVTTTVNGWATIRRCGQPGNGFLVRAACAKALPMVNSVEEAAYWTADIDGAGRRLSGDQSYVLHFPAGQLPPNDAFWSLTLTDLVGYLITNPLGRSSLDDRSALEVGADGSIDVYVARDAPAGHEANWLPAPAGRFKLWLRAYRPGPAILDGSYHLPPLLAAR